MSVSPTDLKNNGFGTILQLINGGIPIVQPSIVTTDTVPTQLYSMELGTDRVTAIRATIIAIRTSGVIVAKFVREFTVKRVGSGSATLLQDIAPSPDYKEDSNLDVTATIDGPSAVILVTGLSGTIEWHSLIEIVS
jgi:hypothetical protein